MVLSTTDLVDNQTSPGATQPATQEVPKSVLYDSVNGDFYVRGYLGDSLTVVDGSTNAVIQEIGVPYSQPTSEALSMAVDLATGFVYTSNFNEGNLSIINGTTNTVTGSISVGGSPDGLAYDSTNGYLYVADWGLPSVVVVNPSTHSVVTNIPVGSHPGAILYDPNSNQVFVANWVSGNVSVIDPVHQKVVANISTGSQPDALALDTHNDYVDVANTGGGAGHVTVIPAATDTGAFNRSVGASPYALAYAPKQNELFVANSASANVSVINQTTGLVVVNPSAGTGPQAEVFDPSDRDVYVLNSESYTVDILNPATNTNIGVVSTDNGYAYALAVDTGNGEVYAVNEGSSSSEGFGPPPSAQANVTVISSATHLAVASIPLEVYPWGVTYDPNNDQLIVANPGGNDTYLVNPATDVIDRIVEVGLEPKWSAVDTTNGEVFVVAYNTTFPYYGTVTVLSSGFAWIKTITTGVLPTGIAYDSASGTFYVTDNFGGNVTVLNGTTNKIVKVIPVHASENLEAVGYDPHNNEIYVADATNGTVGVIDPSTNQFVKWVHVGAYPWSFAFDAQNNTMFVANEASGNYSVIDDSTNTVVHTATLTYAEYLTYDDSNNLIYNAESNAGYVGAINATTYASAGPAIYLGSTVYPHYIAYDPANQQVFVTTQFQGSLSVIGTPSATKYPVTFIEAGLPGSSLWNVTLNSVQNHSITNTIGFSEPAGSWAFTVGTVSGYTANVTSGTVVVTTGPKTVYIGFTATVSNYAVTFVETGLPALSLWNVTFHSVANSSTTSSIGFLDPNGTWSFTVGVVTGYVANNTSGSVIVQGLSQNVRIGFSAVPTYAVNFTESGLPMSTPWSVTLAGTPKGNSTSSISFTEPSGSYSFTVGSVVGYSASPNSGSVHVVAAAVDQPIVFTAGTLALSVTLSAVPSTITLGNSTILTATTSGGTPPFTYVYTGLPTGCASENASSWSCSPTVTGSFTITVTITDAQAGTAHANAALNVTSVAGKTSPSSSGESWWWIILVVIAVILVAVFVIWRRRHHPPPQPAPMPPIPTPLPPT